MQAKASRPVKLEFFGARGEGILDAVRRLGIGGIDPDAPDSQAMLVLSEYIIENFDGTDLAAVLAAAAIAQEYGSIWSTPFDEIDAVAPSSPIEGTKYINTGDGKGYIFYSGDWVPYTPAVGQVAYVQETERFYKFTGTKWTVQFGKVVRTSEFDTLADAFTFAAAANAVVHFDSDVTLTGNLVVAAGVRGVVMDGGVVTMGNYDITFAGQSLRGEPYAAFVLNGTGLLKGTISTEAWLEWWGAAGDGVTNDRTAIQKAIDFSGLGNSILVSEKTFLFTGGGITIPATGMKLAGVHRTRSKIKTSTAAQYMFNGPAVTGVYARDLTFEAADGDSVAIVVSGASSKVRIKNCHTIKCGIFHSDSSSGTGYAGVNDGNSPSDIQIDDCNGLGNYPGGSAGSLGFVNLFYCNNVRVNRCVADGYLHGFQFWGGDSNPAVDGAVANTRKARDITFTACRAVNIAMGGLWGSMGRNVWFEDCHADTCNDVGMDFEGCFESGANGGSARNCTFGGLTAFFGAQNTVFNNVSSIATGAFTLLARTYNSSLNAIQESVTFNGCLFQHFDAIGSVDNGNGPSHFLRIVGCQFKNATISFAGNNTQDTTVENTQMSFTRTLSGGAALTTGNGIGGLWDGNAAHHIVSNVQIRSSVAQTGAAIYLPGGDNNYQTTFDVSDCLTSGFAKDAVLEWNGPNGGIKGMYKLADNRFCGATIDVTGINGSTVTKSNNLGPTNGAL